MGDSSSSSGRRAMCCPCSVSQAPSMPAVLNHAYLFFDPENYGVLSQPPVVFRLTHFAAASTSEGFPPGADHPPRFSL
ncbi:MAG TPA: hypothetical protein VKW70_08130 [Terriglobia bacterium]|nr:hypothetical protein [Terriglobia bacterium]